MLQLKENLGTIIVSDIHFNRTFDRKKLSFLESLFTHAEKIIINGDLWSYFLQDFDQFLNGPYKALFPLMKEKQTIYLYGNHDREEWCDSRTDLFSIKAIEKYNFKEDEVDLYITHGNKIAYDSSVDEKVIRLNRKYYEFNRLNQSYRIYPYFMRSITKLRNSERFHTYFTRVNNPYKEFASKLPGGQILVMGHTHIAEYKPEEKFINLGFINYGLVHFLSIKDGIMKFHTGSYN